MASYGDAGEAAYQTFKDAEPGRNSRLALFMKNIELHQAAELDMAKQANAYRLSRQNDSAKYQEQSFVGNSFEPALRAYAKQHNIPIPEGRISRTDSASLMNMIKMDMSRQLASQKISAAGQGQNKVLAGLLAKQKAKVADARAAWEVFGPQIDAISTTNAKSRGGYTGAAAQKFESATGGRDTEEFKNTAETINNLQGYVVKVLKSSFGAQLSDAEREYMDKVVGAAEHMSVIERGIAIAHIKNSLESKVKEAEVSYREMGGTDMSPVGKAHISLADELMNLKAGNMPTANMPSNEVVDPSTQTPDNTFGPASPDAQAEFDAANPDATDTTAPADYNDLNGIFTPPDEAPYGADPLGNPLIAPPGKRRGSR